MNLNVSSTPTSKKSHKKTVEKPSELQRQSTAKKSVPKSDENNQEDGRKSTA